MTKKELEQRIKELEKEIKDLKNKSYSPNWIYESSTYTHPIGGTCSDFEW